MGLLFRLKSKTSKNNVDAEFEMSDDNTELYMTILGKYEGELIQIDFKPILEDTVDDLIEYLEKVKDKIIKKP